MVNRFILLTGLIFLCPASLQARRIIVGSGKAFSSIGAAIQAAAPNDTIIVLRGIYREGNLRIRKSLVLLGEGNPVLDGESKYEIISVEAPHVTISGFELINSGTSNVQDLAGIGAVQADYLIVQHNRFINTYFGIHVSNTTGCVIEDNFFKAGQRQEYETGNGIHLWQCSNARIRNNHIMLHRDGIYFEFVTQSVIEGNTSSNNFRYGLHFMFSHEDDYRHNIFKQNGAGVAVMYTRKVKMEFNTFEQNEGSSVYGLLLKDISDSEVKNNIFLKNTIAIYMEGTSRTHFIRNTFKQNGYGVRLQASCDDNVFTENNFLQNTFDFTTNGMLVLNKIDGNYWDKYQGYDLNKDQTGDIPYHPVNLYSMVVERVPMAVFLWRSFLVFLLDRAERAFPAITPENLKDNYPRMKPYDLRSSA
ncbi:MAG: nitrous oxide reductase family maturation protein NosD [Cyclobacteriaceae bacterium]|nr:nitrous oxide reductase family maturation protein NosD [Cyclobacteriaceae bacterium]MCX7637122.1 nitrous oxide reductase family maturation protein NosD [Cyclobacteriaceae bacterium]